MPTTGLLVYIGQSLPANKGLLRRLSEDLATLVPAAAACEETRQYATEFQTLTIALSEHLQALELQANRDGTVVDSATTRAITDNAAEVYTEVIQNIGILSPYVAQIELCIKTGEKLVGVLLRQAQARQRLSIEGQWGEHAIEYLDLFMTCFELHARAEALAGRFVQLRDTHARVLQGQLKRATELAQRWATTQAS